MPPFRKSLISPGFRIFRKENFDSNANIFENEKMRNRENDGQNNTKIQRVWSKMLYLQNDPGTKLRLETRATERNRARVQPNVATRVHWRNSWSEGAGLNRFNPSSQHPTPSRILLSKNSEFPLESIGVDPRKHLGRRGLAEFLERLMV